MDHYEKLAARIRYQIVTSTTKAGSGHPSSSLSAVELLTVLFFSGVFKYRVDDPEYHNNDRLIMSKGHAAPLLYALWAAAGAIENEELATLRTLESRLGGHPTMDFPYTEVVTGSLGQGLSVGVGMALNAKYLDKLTYKTYVLLGDGEMAEGSNWEAMQIAAHYKLDNLVGIIDVNRLQQTGETMYGHDLDSYAQKAEAFGWHPIIVDGHDVVELQAMYRAIEKGETSTDKPVMIIAKTFKGYGISALQNKEGWHGKPLPEDKAQEALKELGDVDLSYTGEISAPEEVEPAQYNPADLSKKDNYDVDLAPRKAYGHALVKLHEHYPDMVVLDADLSNSTFAQDFKETYPERFFEMFIAEQNMVGVATGLALRGKKPFVSTFGSFLMRAADQIRISQYTQAGINYVGSHVGVSMGPDGPTQMGLEDMALFRAMFGSVVLYPADHVATEKLVAAMIEDDAICYLRTTRMDVEPLYKPGEMFEIGGSKTWFATEHDDMTLVAAGVTLHEALKARDMLVEKGVNVRVIDLYSIKPVDVETLQKAALETKILLTIEDHYAQGGLGAAVREVLADRPVRIHSMAVTKMPRSGDPDALLDYEHLSAKHIAEKVINILDKT